MKRYILLLLLTISNGFLFGQTSNTPLSNQIESLKREIIKSQPDSILGEVLKLISSKYLHINPDSAISYGEKAITVFERTENIPDQIVTMGIIGESYIKQGNMPKALELGLEAIDMSNNLGVRASGVGRSYDNLGLIYYYLGSYEKSLHYFRKLIPRGDVDIMGVAFGYYGIAWVYEKMNDLDSALIFLDKSRETFHTINNSSTPYQYEVYPAWYNCRAQVYLKQNKAEEALADLRTTLDITIESKEVFHTANTYNDISEYYIKVQQPDSAIYYAEKGLTEARKISYIQGISHASQILAEQYELNDPVKTLHFFKLAAETQNRLYGAGNIQIMRDMIAQQEKEQAESEAAEIDFRNRLRTNALLGSTFTLIVIAIFLFRSSRLKQKAKQKIEDAYDQLKSTQTQLIHSEKMASLGELTAGIAHEIQNPLNFVNNFSDVNKELILELNEAHAKGDKAEIETITKDILENEEKVTHHGKRAEAIVKSMLQHSRGSEGKKELTDINALADEYLRLAYHGMRAKDKDFNADFETDFDQSLPKINVVPQDIGRVLLNLINNAFYAVSAKALSTDGEYKPTVSVSTKHVPLTEGVKGEEKFEIRVKDNGPGIPEEIKDKIFQPFFTTKAAGEGTGLGLSLSYDIVIKGHGGTMDVESEKGEGTEFKISLPV